MKIVIILNDPPYGTERAYNGLRLALALSQHGSIELRIFLLGDAVGCGVAGQKTAEGYYNLERMLKGLVRRGVQIGACGTCLDARGIPQERLIEGVQRSSMEQLAELSLWADKIFVF